MKYGYDVDHEKYTEITRAADPDEYWDADSTATTWSVQQNVHQSTQKYPDLISSLKLVPQKDYFLVYLIYTTSDSFSSSEGYACLFIDVFETQEKAQNLVDQIINQNKDYQDNKKDLGEDEYLLTYQDETGEKNTIYCDWNGYFESIDLCKVHKVTLS